MSNNTPSYYRARVEAIGQALAYELSLPESREGQMRIAYLRNGHVPDRFLRGNYGYENEYSFTLKSGLTKTVYQYVQEFQSTNNQSPLTELELHTYDTYFQLHPEKVCGTQQGGSGYSFPVRTIGSRADIEQAIDATLKKSANSPSKVRQKSFTHSCQSQSESNFD